MAKQLHTFTGETASEAQKKAIEALGKDALLVSTKEIRKKSLNQTGLFEMVFMTEGDEGEQIENVIKNSPNSVQKRIDEVAKKQLEKKREEKAKKDEEVTLMLSDAVRDIAAIANVPTSMPKTARAKKDLNSEIDVSDLKIKPDSQKPAKTAPSKTISNANPYKEAIAQSELDSEKSTKAAKNQNLDDEVNNKIEETQKLRLRETQFERGELKDIKKEIEKLNDRMKLMQSMIWEKNTPDLNIPQEFAEIYRVAKSSGMNKEHLDLIMKMSLELMPLKMRESSVTIRRYFREVLRKMIYCRSENLKSTQKRVIMLVGPTGVGKTTILAKLAARYGYMTEKRNKVGILTLDTYRMGAVEQIMAYARMMRLSIETIGQSDELAAALDNMRHCDYILIDTPGHSQNDHQRLEILKDYINDDYKIDVALVLALNAKYEDLKDTYAAFSDIMEIDQIIFSKLDESRNFGNMFSFVYETKKPISYLSVGQGVPDDLLPASNDYLVDCLLDGFKR